MAKQPEELPDSAEAERSGPASLGEQEMELLRFVSGQAPVSAGQVAAEFGEERGLARTTVLTVLERLRKKGYVTRRKRAGVFQYSPRHTQMEVLQGMVHRFVETTLSGSLAPVVQYLANSRRLSPSELEELQQLVQELRAQSEETQP